MVLGTIELGGTKTLVAAGTSPHDLDGPQRIRTMDPGPTLEAAIDYLLDRQVEAVGVASFGPLELRTSSSDFGTIISTPKPGWSGVPVFRRIADTLDVPVAIDTDVNGAALGEGEWGSAEGFTSWAYVTVGTGIGLGAVINGRTLVAAGHPEFGHVVVRRSENDDYPGRCPFHRDCLEGLASGPALEDRFGPSASWDDESRVAALDLAVAYLSQGLRTAVYAYAPERLIVGGGVGKLPGFHRRLGEALVGELAGYPAIPVLHRSDYVVPPAFEDSGLVGGLVLARQALLSSG